MSEINTTPRHTKDWTVDDDSDDDVEELARQLGTPSRSKLQQQEQEREGEMKYSNTFAVLIHSYL